MSKKVIIVGASHGGHEAIRELLNRYNDIDITLFESGDFISFMSCGMELYLENKVTNVNDVRNFGPDTFTEPNVHVLNNHTVTKINSDKKTVTVKDNKGQVKDYPYDKLILSSGVTPNSLPVKGTDLENVYLMRGKDWATKIKSKLTDPSVKNMTIIGAGYIGIEAAEASVKAGKHVTLLDMIDRPLGAYLDKDMTDILNKELTDKGVDVEMGQAITEFEGKDGKVTAVKTKTNEFPSDVVIQGAGVKANTNWMKGTVDLDNRGWMKTNEYLQTNVPDVYAIGDATLAYSIPAESHMPIALATVARREARYVSKHLFEKKPDVPFKGVVGSSALSVFDYHFAQSGLNSTTAKRAGVNIKTSFYEDRLRPPYVPVGKDNPKVYVYLAYKPDSHQIVGGAVLSKYDITAQDNALSLAISNKMRLEDLADADFFFQPGFDRQWSLLNLAAQHALGESKF
ncbi:FAD-dependent oxidoreductase [Lactobacillus acetotolerans]|uniref:FAD-dependent oxidoreductase n=1 Tax=Lactobacillus acetotolerans TaxID=1600 RepID=UPI0007BA447F|nr:FAD-dependent oxidoreductase [Lactobacillus acetotolerans]QGV04387.1 FAD-dependent oxidoreductase [Lactobacillus acetotolerans]